MKKNKIIFFFLLLSLAIFFPLTGKTETAITFANIEVRDFENGRGRIIWDTPQTATKAIIYWGENPEDLHFSLGYGSYSYFHETFISGLEKDKTYYFKIVALGSGGEKAETFLQTFNTNKMVDTLLPEILEREATQTTKDAAVINWTTDEETTANLRYGLNSFDLNKGAGDGRLAREHQIILYGLDSDQKYYLKIEAEDRSKNKKARTFSFRTGTEIDRDTDLKIMAVEPLNINSGLIKSREATIRWQTNLAAKSRLRYGLRSRQYDKTVEINKDIRQIKNEINLKDLAPETTYYYEIEAYDGIYGKNLKNPELTFTTLKTDPVPGLLPGEGVIRQKREYFDSDSDRLSDGLEMEIGTDPFQFDSDGDGYGDGEEMAAGFDPLIAGSGPETRLKAERYFRPRLPKAMEEAKSKELEIFIRSRTPGYAINNRHWPILLNAFVYGQYPAEAIGAAIRHGGKTVHPRISWSAWKNSEQYLSYINR